MKKLLLFTFAAALLLGVSACKKTTKEPDTLVNTVWVGEEVEGANVVATHTLEFKTESTGTATTVDLVDPEDGGSNDFTYSYNAPTITLNTPEGPQVGTVNGNTMDFGNGMVLTKQ